MERITEEMVINTLQTWGYNSGEIEEVVVLLTQNAGELIQSIDEPEIYDCGISYKLTLTKKGVEVYDNWRKRYGYTSSLKGSKKNVLIIVDENRDSVKNTLEEWF